MIVRTLKRAKACLGYVFYVLIFIVAFDTIVFKRYLGFGYPKHYVEENIQRYPAPYVMFTGKPNILDHNEGGFRGPSFARSRVDDLKVAFFGGSTGYFGNPPIAKIVENQLIELVNASVFVANYSVVSSNHRQHLHGIIEFLPLFKPDIVIFYGGYNETLQNAYYDPRPAYPYNFFYRAETGPLVKLLLENSAIIGEIDKKLNVFSGLRKLKNEQRPLSNDWNKRISEKYFETLELAKTITSTIESRHFGKTKFFAFYQPYQVPKEFLSTHNGIRKHINDINYIFDVSSEYDDLGKGVYADIVHVNQQALEVMGARIAKIIANALKK